MKGFLKKELFKKVFILITSIVIISSLITVYLLNVGAASTSGNFTVDYKLQSNSNNNATVSMKISNNGSDIKGWSVNWTFNGNQKINNIWGATFSQSGSNVTLTNVDWTASIPKGGSQTIGFNISFSGNNSIPSNFTVKTSSQSSSTNQNTVKVSSNITNKATSQPNQTTSQNTNGKIKGSEVLVIGDSFIAMSHEITKYLEQHAKSAGILDQNDKFRDFAVSGTKLSGGVSPSIPDQYKNARQQGNVKYVIMDGGGNDCLQSSSALPWSSSTPEVSAATSAAKSLFSKMGSDGVKKVQYFFYPDPQGSLSSMKNKLDVLRPLVQSIVTGSSSPKGYLLDLRPAFSGKYNQYITSDGIHPNSTGCKAAADAIWEAMKTNNFFN